MKEERPDRTVPDHRLRPEDALTHEERELGMGADITRRDFLNAVAVGSGAALLGARAPAFGEAPQGGAATGPAQGADPWTGYGGVGDYARSNGNTWEVVNAGHGLRDRLYEQRIAAATSTGETYDLVIVGGGYAGTIAAYTFLEETGRQRQCLMLENHPVVGGEAKRNEFIVRGHCLMGPQGSNQTSASPSGPVGEILKQAGYPTEFEFGELPPGRRRMEFPLDNYYYQFWADDFENHGYFFDAPTPHWVTNPFAHGLDGTPWPEEVRRDLLRWHNQPAETIPDDLAAYRRWLDTMTYDDYLIKERKLHPEVARFADPILANASGLGCDGVSAVVGFDIFRALGGAGQKLSAVGASRRIISYPGGNDAVMRAIVKVLNPDVIEGGMSFADIHNGAIRFDAMDRPNAPCRMRVGATVVRVSHDPDQPKQPAVVTYVADGKLYSVRARTIVWAGASWTAKRAIQPLPPEYGEAMESFTRAPILVVNVALDNWRALYRLGYTACSWRGGFGYTANLRAPMYVGNYRPPLDPDQPTVFTFYVPWVERGLPLAAQGQTGREKMFATSYREFETEIRQQMVKMFGSAGFDPKRDIAGIVLNRWGHAYVAVGPGFYFGRNGKPAPSDVLRRPLGTITFAHSEFSGHQSAGYAVTEAVRAAHQVLGML
jgi:spermidine dehydrogenase